MDILDRVKLRMGISDDSKDALLSEIIADVKEYVAEYCNRSGVDDIPETLNSAIVKMAIIDYNRLGTEGLTSEGYTGVSYSYEPNYPDDIRRQLNHERLVRMW